MTTRFFFPAFAVFSALAVKLIVATPLEFVIAEPMDLPFKVKVTFKSLNNLPFISFRAILYFPP